MAELAGCKGAEKRRSHRRRKPSAPILCIAACLADGEGCTAPGVAIPAWKRAHARLSQVIEPDDVRKIAGKAATLAVAD